MKIEVKLGEGGYLPEKAHEDDAGFDIFVPDGYAFVTIPARGSVVVDTKVHMMIPGGYVGMLKSKSGLNVKRGVRGEGVIDAGYTGSIVAKMYNDSDYDHIIRSGEKLIQIVILPIPQVEMEHVGEFKVETDRGCCGFGSSGR